jgi:hypothetical protein
MFGKGRSNMCKTYKEEAERLLGYEELDGRPEGVFQKIPICRNSPVEVLAKVLEEKADCEGCRQLKMRVKELSEMYKRLRKQYVELGNTKGFGEIVNKFVRDKHVAEENEKLWAMIKVLEKDKEVK